MKIEMGESLFYSWLRHVKECQVVQMNWKASPSWQLRDERRIKKIHELPTHTSNKYGYGVIKNNSLSQLLMQAEVDASESVWLETDKKFCFNAYCVLFMKRSELWRQTGNCYACNKEVYPYCIMHGRLFRRCQRRDYFCITQNI